VFLIIPSLISSFDSVFSDNATAPLTIPTPLVIKDITQEIAKTAKDRMLNKTEFGPRPCPPSAGNIANNKNKKATELPPIIIYSALM
jgi:hypothetical protein